MGDLSDANDLDRFIRSKQGKAHLRKIVIMLKGRTIKNVTFANEVRCLVTTLHLDDNSTFDVYEPSLEVDILREEFADAIEEEYYKDYPDRRPGKGER